MHLLSARLARFASAIFFLADFLGKIRQRHAGTDQDGVKTGIDHAKGRSLMQFRIIPVQAAEELHQPEITVTYRLFVGRCEASACARSRRT